jgi:hypothetical protein
MRKTEKSVVWILFAGKPEKFPASQFRQAFLMAVIKQI